MLGPHPGPTAISALGTVLIVANGLGAALATALPVLRCVVAALTLIVLLQPYHSKLG